MDTHEDPLINSDREEENDPGKELYREDSSTGSVNSGLDSDLDVERRPSTDSDKILRTMTKTYV